MALFCVSATPLCGRKQESVSGLEKPKKVKLCVNSLLLST